MTPKKQLEHAQYLHRLTRCILLVCGSIILAATILLEVCPVSYCQPQASYVDLYLIALVTCIAIMVPAGLLRYHVGMEIEHGKNQGASNR